MIIIKNISSIINYEKNKNDQVYKEALLGTVSHEMMTPLNSITNLSSLIKIKSEQRKANYSFLNQNTLIS